MSQKNAYDVLQERGFIAQTNHADELRELLGKTSVSFYVGFDPTADSLHVGHLVQLMAMAHLQQAGHKPYALMGGGTAMIGDPSGRTDMRKMLSRETIDKNASCFKAQMSKIVNFGPGQAETLNNADWIFDLGYIDFLREFGVHFTVNHMLAADCYKNRLEGGLTVLEFNYMLLQAYDFYRLYKNNQVQLEMGGDDQWSNILAGTDLIRSKLGKQAYALTLKLLTTADGRKMGKTAKGALWLDANKCSVYDFYQYWRNLDDRDVVKCMKLLTFMDMEEIAEYAKLEGQALNEGKKRLAREITALVHGEAAAQEAEAQADSIFGASGSGRASGMPGTEITEADLGKPLIDLLVDAAFISSKSEGRRLMKQGGLNLNDHKVEDFNRTLEKTDLIDGAAIVRRGKKKVFALKLQGK